MAVDELPQVKAVPAADTLVHGFGRLWTELVQQRGVKLREGVVLKGAAGARGAEADHPLLGTFGGQADREPLG